MNIYIQQLSNLNTAKIAGKKAPHKAILLLAILDLIETGLINSPRVELSEQLERTFDKNWRKYVGSSLIFRPMVATPFWHMQNEPFYKLYLNNGKELISAKGQYSIKWLRDNTYATIDNDLYEMMKNETNRALLRVMLISTYLKGVHTNTDTMISLLTLLGLFANLAA